MSVDISRYSRDDLSSVVVGDPESVPVSNVGRDTTRSEGPSMVLRTVDVVPKAFADTASGNDAMRFSRLLPWVGRLYGSWGCLYVRLRDAKGGRLGPNWGIGQQSEGKVYIYAACDAIVFSFKEEAVRYSTVSLDSSPSVL